MKCWHVAFLGILVLGVAVTLVLLLRTPNASLLLINGRIYTLADEGSIVEATAIDGDRIVAVGTTREILSSFRCDSVVDLKGKTVFPGFIDAHAHVEGLGLALMTLNVLGLSSAQDVANAVAPLVAQHRAEGTWIRGRGWDQTRWAGGAFPTRELLDAVAPDVPVYLVRVDGHAAWVNSRVLGIAGITRATPDPPGGRILRDANGEPTGVVLDAAMDSIRVVMPSPTPGEREQAVALAVRAWIEQGATQVHDMGVDSQLVRIYKGMAEQGRLPFRVYAVFDGPGGGWDEAREAGPLVDGFGGRLTLRALKLYADGALGSRGAALIRPYSDDPGNRGITVTSAADLRKTAEEAVRSGFQVCTHAIGDRGNAVTLDVYQEVINSLSAKPIDLRLRVEHAQILDPSDIPRFAAMGVIPSMQPTHCTSDMYWVEQRVGPVRARGAYAWRSLLDHGSIIPAGSDAPVEAPSPLWAFYAAITRQDHRGAPEGGWHPEQRMSREEALKSLTVWGAYAAFQEKTKGKIAPGYWADLVVLSKDIMTVTPPEILTTEVEWTIIAGEIVKRPKVN